MVESKLWNKESNLEGILTGEIGDYKSGGKLDKDSVAAMCDLSRQACILRIEEVQAVIEEEEAMDKMPGMSTEEAD